MPNDLPAVIPLFPLPDVVLFPGMPLPLHVFETRYRKMVVDALGGHRIIGIVLLRPGWEADYYGRPVVYPVGGAGRLDQCNPLDDGRFDILLRGFTRFRILDEDERAGEPYRLARVEPLGDPPPETEVLRTLRPEILAALMGATDGPSLLVAQDEIPDELFVNGLCQSLRLEAVERQSLLDCAGIEARSRRLLEILEFKRLAGAGGEGKVH